MFTTLTSTIQRLLAACIMLPLAMTAAATPQEQSLFDVVVRVPDESTAVQRAAFTRGLQQVLIRLSGDSRVLDRLELPPASRYVRQYRYDKLQSPVDDTGLLTRDQLQLWMRFDADKVQALLRDNQLPLWSPQRDRMVVWLAVRDGNRHYLLRQQDQSLIKTAVEQAARDRGLPLVWPAYDETDRQQLLFADVWAGFPQPLLRASARYSSGAVLAGNLAWDGSQWVSEWSVMEPGRPHERRRYDNADYATVIAQAVNRLADELGARYAVREDDSAAGARLARVEIQGVNSLARYRQSEQLLRGLAEVKSVMLAELFEDFAVFRVSLRGSREDFLQRLKRNRQLQPLPVPLATAAPVAAADSGQPQSSTPVPVYRYQLQPAATL